MKVFISQPMSGKTNEEIIARRKEIIEMIENKYLNENISFVYSIIEDEPSNDTPYKPVWYLGDSIKKLATATLAYFDKGWQKARGCCIEHDVCELYKIPITDWTNF